MAARAVWSFADQKVLAELQVGPRVIERAEHLLAIQGLADQVPIDESIDVGQLIDEIFSREHWPNVPGSE